MLNKFIIKSIFILIVSLMILSCSSTKPIYDISNTIDQSRVHFSRTKNIVGSAIVYNIFIDKNYVGSLSSGDYFFEDLKPGKHKLLLTSNLSIVDDIHAVFITNSGKNYEYIIDGTSQIFQEVIIE